MFYLVDKSNGLVREHDNKMALRRIRRKQPKNDSLRIVEGKTLKEALKKEAVAPKEEVTKKEKKSKKEVVAPVEATKKSKRKSKKAKK